MSENPYATPPVGGNDHQGASPVPPQAAYQPPPPVAYQPLPPADYRTAGIPIPYTQAIGPVGKVRGTGTCILLTIVTLGIYSLYWYYSVHDEMKRHSGQGLGGGLAFVIAFFVGIVSPFITSSEVGNLYRSRGLAAPVSGATGLWSFPGVFILVGPLVWFIKTNGAINRYWRTVGAA